MKLNNGYPHTHVCWSHCPFTCIKYVTCTNNNNDNKLFLYWLYGMPHIQPLSRSMKALILTNALVRFVLLVQNNICRCLIILASLHHDTHIIRNLTRANSVTTNEYAVATPYVLCSFYFKKYLYRHTSYRIFIKHSRIVRASKSIVVKCLAFAWNILPFAYTTHVALVYLRIPRRTLTQHALVWVNWLIEIN